MDESLQELENELKRLTPRRPSARATRLIERELDSFGRAAPRAAGTEIYPGLRVRTWVPWTVAAAVAVVFTLQFVRQPPAVDRSRRGEVAVVPAHSVGSPADDSLNRYKPVKATSVLYDLKEDGAATSSDDSEGRQVRYRYVDTYTWKNPANNASLRWSVPRDEVRVVRASLD